MLIEEVAALAAPGQMTLNEYQEQAARSAGNCSLAVLGLGISGEAGEVADLIKKYIGHGHPLDHVKLARELGDVLWYVAVMAEEIGLSLDGVAILNIAKLQARYPDGFDPQKSVDRDEET
jgi:NTP pyrophosphatase (non-canonical NTP hydrolase)